MALSHFFHECESVFGFGSQTSVAELVGIFQQLRGFAISGYDFRAGMVGKQVPEMRQGHPVEAPKVFFV